MKKKTLSQLAREQGLLTQQELCLRLGRDTKVVRSIGLPCHGYPGLTRKYYNLHECAAIVEDYFKIKNRAFVFEDTCNMCGCVFSYERVKSCTGKTERYIRENIDTYSVINRRVRCDNCKSGYKTRPQTEEQKQYARECMLAWWENLSYQKRAAMSKKQSVKKKIFWENNWPLREKLSEEWSGAMKRGWGFWRTQKESKNHE